MNLEFYAAYRYIEDHRRRRMAEADHERLVKAANAGRRPATGLFRPALHRTGQIMVNLGERLLSAAGKNEQIAGKPVYNTGDYDLSP